MQDILKPADPDRTAILMVEFQKEWLDPAGKLNPVMQDRALFEGAIEGGARLLAFGREAGLTIVHSGLSFRQGYPELGIEGLGLRGAIKKHGTFPKDGMGSEWADGFTPLPYEFVVSGRTGASVFSGSDLDAFMRANRLDTLLIAGFALHVCVESTLRDAHDRALNTYVVSNAVAAFNTQQQEHVLTHVVPHFGQVISVDQLPAIITPH